MITDRINPPGLQEIPGLTHVTVGTGSKLVCISGQTGVDTEGKVAGSTHLDQARQAFTNLATALQAADVGPHDVARLNIYVVDYSEEALAAIFTAAYEAMGDDVAFARQHTGGGCGAVAARPVDRDRRARDRVTR